MADTSELKPFLVSCNGGLILDRDVFSMPEGSALELQNFEPDISGGYRRILGFTKYSTTALSGTGKVLGLVLRGDTVIGCRGANVQYGSGTTWTNIVTNRTSAGRYKFDLYNWNGTETLIMADDSNGLYAATWDGTTYTLMNGAAGSGAGTAPTYAHDVKEHKGHMFYATNYQVFFSAPYAANDFTAGAGAGSFTIGDTVVGMKQFREDLIIFGKNSIYKITGTALSNFALKPIARNIGCASAWSIQEIGGDLLFLAPDGLRTVSKTARIDDTELGTISKPVQKRFDDITDYDTVSSCVIRKKSQYRIWYPPDSTAAASCLGTIAVYKRLVTKNDIQTPMEADNQIGWEFSDIKGMKPSYSFSGYVGDTETILHGGYTDGIVYKQENTNAFDTTTINAIFRTPDLYIEDSGTRKTMHRILFYVKPNGTLEATLNVIYNYNDDDTPQPDVYSILDTGATAAYGTAVYNTSSYSVIDTVLRKTLVEGSGNTVSLKITENNQSSAFSIKSFQLEFSQGGRR